jgi:hypothetical protein
VFCNSIFFLGGRHGFYAGVIATASGAWQETIRKAVNRIASGFAFAMTYLPVVIACHRVPLARHCDCERSVAESNPESRKLDYFMLRPRNDDMTIMVNKVPSLRDYTWGAYCRMLKHTVNKMSSLRDFTHAGAAL